MPTISNRAVGGTGLLAIFCDLAEPDKTDFRPWLAEEMFPARVAIGFRACASFDRVSGEGPEFATLYETSSPGDLYGRPYQRLRENRSQRDLAYHQKFQNPERHTLTWVGPELTATASSTASLAASMFSEYIHVDRFELPSADIQPFNMWFVNTYLPGLTELRGFARVRRYLSLEGKPAHFVLHEFADMSFEDDPAWRNLRENFIKSQSGLYRRIVHAPPEPA
ncbi:MAG: hypothetical protein ACR2OW_09130 [Methyloligellaceae bacterium]